MMKIKTFITGAVLLVGAFASLSTTTALASGGPEIKLVGAEASRVDSESLQRGARLFVNHCVNCHSAQFMRYSRLKDLGLTEEQIQKNFMFAGQKIGDQMKVAMNPKDAKEWFGATPPDLSVMARSYTTENLAGYLRSFYRDDSRPTGWNNLVSPNIGMPHALASLSGTSSLVEQTFTADGKDIKTEHEAEARAKAAFVAAQTISTFEHHVEKKEGKTENHYIVKSIGPAVGGSMSAAEYDVAVADLVNFMDFLAEPNKAKRIQIGILMLFLLSILFAASFWLKKTYWKDIH